MPDSEHRLAGLDLIRGIAVLGIALMNVASFALPPAAYDNPVAYGPASPRDLAIWAIEFLLVDGKLRALFSMLFGASLLLVADRAEAGGRDPGTVHVRRMLWLLVIGLLHALLIWPGDILVMYALVGLAAFTFRDKPITALLVAAAMCLVAQMAAAAVALVDLGALRAAAAAPHAPAAARAAWAATLDALGPGRAGAAIPAMRLHDAGYGAILTDRLAQGWSTRVAQLEEAGLETLGFVLIGMAGLRSGALAGAWPRRRYARIAIACTAIGIAGEVALLGWCFASRLDPVTLSAAAILGGAPLRPLLALGYAALALLLASQGALAMRLRAVGRMALSGYVGTSILFSLLFDGYGLGLYGRLTRAELLLPVAMLWLGLLLACPLWLRHFRHGPLEWLWRSLARGAAQPMRRKAIAI